MLYTSPRVNSGIFGQYPRKVNHFAMIPVADCRIMTTALRYKARPSLTPKKQSLTDMAYSAIKAEINSGRIPPDSFINIPEIEHQLDMSRTPIREAMLRLQTEKIVEIVPKRGICIRSLTVQDLTDLLQIIAGLELQAIGNICRRKLTRTDIMPLLYALSSLETSLRSADHEAWALAEEAFHRSLFVLNGNQKLSEAGLSYRDIVQRAHFGALRHIFLKDKERYLRDHSRLKELILAGDEASAREVFLEHCTWASEMISEALAMRDIKRL
ncbi:MAG: GntR family transcriptional regulator [Sneathiella sp.]|nr:GntR family transcriptional regulator [Sneathiella sp.]